MSQEDTLEDDNSAPETEPTPVVEAKVSAPKAKVPTWRKWTIRMGWLWIPFATATTVTLILSCALPSAVLPFLEPSALLKLLVCSWLTAAMPSLVLTWAVWRFARRFFLFARPTVWLCEVVGITYFYSQFALAGLSDALPALVQSDPAKASEICARLEDWGKNSKQVRTDLFSSIGRNLTVTPATADFLERVLKIALETETPKSPRLSDLYIKLGESYDAQHNAKAAAYYYNLAVATFPPQEPSQKLGLVYSRLQRALTRTGAYTDCEAISKKALDLFAAKPEMGQSELLLNAASNLDKEGKFNVSEPLYQKLLAGPTPAQPELVAQMYFDLAKHYASIQNYSEAQKYVASRLELKDKSQAAERPAALALQGILLCQRGDLKEAEQSFKQALQLSPMNKEALIGMALLLDARSQYRQADWFYALAESVEAKDIGALLISEGRFKRLLTRLSDEQQNLLRPHIPFMPDLAPNAAYNFALDKKFLNLDTRPQLIDCREPKSKETPSAQNTFAEAAVAQTLAKIKKPPFKWANQLCPVRQKMAAEPLPGSFLPPLTFQQLMPHRFVLLSEADLQTLRTKLKKTSWQDMIALSASMSKTAPARTGGHSYRPEDEEFLLQKLSLFQELFGKTSDPTLVTLNELGEFYFDAGKRDKAETYYKQCLATGEKRYGKGSRELQRCRSNLAFLSAPQSKQPEDVLSQGILGSANVIDYRQPLDIAMLSEQAIPVADASTTVAGSIVTEKNNWTPPKLAAPFFGHQPQSSNEIPSTGVKTAGTVYTAYRLHLLLKQIPEDQALKAFEFAPDCAIGTPVTAELAHRLIILDSRPQVFDLRPEGKVVAPGSLISGELARACLARMDSKRSKDKYKAFERWFPNPDKVVREQLPENTSPEGTADSIRNLLPNEILIVPPQLLEQLKKDSGISEEEVNRLPKVGAPAK